MNTTVTRAFEASGRMNVKRRALMVSCASLAIATAAMAPQEAKAQTLPGAFQGTPTTAGGTVVYSRGTGTETITVGSSTATINWSPYDSTGTGNINFLPTANTATFTSSIGLTDYTVLNRIVPTDPTRAIVLDGDIFSFIEGGSTTGGNIWFYSPGGIVVGANAMFDVGGLLLSTLDPGTGWWADANGFSATFSGPSGSTSAIQIDPGAQITALSEGSYVALVAPRIDQGGTVQVNGTAAYAAGEQMTMTMNLGLFDIQIDVGTGDASGIVHSGTTGGPASTGAGDYHRVYMVAVPKNQVLTMGLGGNVGFAPATLAGVENGQIILSAGRDVYESGGGLWLEPATGTLASAHIRGNYSSDVTAVADDRAAIYSDEWGSASFAGDVSLQAPSVHFVASLGNTLSVGGDLTLWSDGGATGDVFVLAQSGGSIDIDGNADLGAWGQSNGVDSSGGTINVIADGGDITVDGSLSANVSAYPWQQDTNGNSLDAYGGTITLLATNGGTLTAGDVFAYATAQGSDTQGSGDGIAGNGFGGSIVVQSDLGGTINVVGALEAYAYGSGGFVDGDGVAAGYGQGGDVLVSANGGAINLGSLHANVTGNGGSVVNPNLTTASGADGYGGSVLLVTYDPASSITVSDDVSLDASGRGGDGQGGGSGYGGSVGIESFAGSIAIGGWASLYAYASGGDATVGFGGTGGSAYGGEAYIQANGASSISATDAFLTVAAYGGSGGAGDGALIAAGAGGYAQGGLYGGASVLADSAGATLELGSLNMYANAYGGAGGIGGTGQAGGAGGDATGGSALAGTFNSGGTTAPAGSASFGNVYMDAGAYGGNGGLGDNGNGGALDGNGGNASGGGNTVCGEFGETCGGAVFNAYGDVTTGNLSLSASATGGNGAIGGDATGGLANLNAQDGSTLGVAGALNVSSHAFGGSGAIDGGSATGGTSVVQAIGTGSLSAGYASVQANAYGGNGDLGLGGTGQGGSAELVADGGTIAIGDGGLQMAANGSGGTGASAGADGTGGSSSLLITANGGSISITGFSAMSANGHGGAGRDNADGTGGTGGNGYGGSVLIDIPTALAVGATASLNLGDLFLTSMGFGGAGGAGITGGLGGNGYGSTTDVNIGSGAATMGRVIIRAGGRGGSGGAGSTGAGGAGGAGFGGSANLTVAGLLDAEYYFANTSTFGGNGGTGTTAGAGGAAASGSTGVQVLAGGSANFVDGLIATSAAFGGQGSTGGAAQAGRAVINVAGSLTSAGIVQSSAQAFGGLGLSGAGGNATSGSASLDVSGDLDASFLYVATNAIGGDGVTAGGNASAGSSMVTITGSATVADASIEANSTGGNASEGVGGNGSAGLALISIPGSWTSTGDVTVSANGLGGAGTAGGGTGYGNDAAVRVYDAGLAQFNGSLTLAATGTGGSSANGTGGDGYGGYARMSAYQGGTIIGNNLTIDSSGIGGDGVDGGDGVASESVEGWGGSVLQSFGTGSSIALTGQTNVLSSGTGGAATGATGVGGDGTGGYASIAAVGTSVTLGDALVEANGTGGAGSGGAGNGVGGLATFRTHDGGSLTGGAVLVHADGSTLGGLAEVLSTGGGDMDVASLNATANGGLTGGDVLVSVDAGGTVDLGQATLTATGGSGTGSVTIDVGGGATAEASPSGDLLFAENLIITSSGTIDVLSRNGAGINVTDTFAATADGVVNLDDQTGGAVLTATTMNLAGSDILFDWGFAVFDIALMLSGDYTLGSLPTAQNSLSVSADGTLTVGDIYSEQTLLLEAGADLILGSISSGGSLSLTAAGDVTSGNLTAEGGLAVSAGGNVATGDLTAGLGVTIDALGSLIVGNVVAGAVPPTAARTTSTAMATTSPGGDIYLSSGGNLQTGDLTAGGAIELDAGGDILFGNASSDTFDFDAGGAATGGNITAVTQANGNAEGAILLGNITVGPGLVPGTDFSVGFSSATSITVGNVQSADRVGFATLGTLTTGDIIAGSLVMALVGADIILGSVTTNPDGTVYLADASMFIAAGGEENFDLAQVLGAAPVATGGSITISGQVSTGTLQAAAGTDLSIASVDAANSVTLSANGLASFLGVVSAPEISVTSGDITIAAGASLGEAGVTQVVNLFAVSSNPVIIGSSGAASSAAATEGSQYVLDEEGDIVADTVNFTAQSATGGTDPDIIVHDVTIEGSQTEGGGVANVNVSTGGNIIVDGHLLYANAAATDSLSLNAGNSIQVVTDAGSVAMTASDGSLSGTLLLTADNIWVGDQALIDQLTADPNFAGRDQALATNNGAANPDGSVRAGAITANVSETLLVQNSGTTDDHAGMSVGDGGLTVNNTGTEPATVVAYGRQTNSDGTVNEGSDFSESVEYTGTPVSAGSSVNGCAVGTTCTTTVTEQPPATGAEAILGPIGMVASPTEAAPADAGTTSEEGETASEEEESESESESEAAVDPSVQLINGGPLQTDVTVDEPVTSGSDAMLSDGPSGTN